MTLAPILAAPLIVQLHILFAVPSLVLGPIALFRRRRDLLHKVTGYLWLISMVALAVSGFFIRSGTPVIGHMGPIHLLCFFTLWGVCDGLRFILKGNVAAHQRAMRQLWFGAVGLAGLFTLVPGRTLNEALLGGSAPVSWGLLFLGLLVLAALWRRQSLRQS